MRLAFIGLGLLMLIIGFPEYKHWISDSVLKSDLEGIFRAYPKTRSERKGSSNFT